MISSQCPLILPSHILLDEARERSLGKKSIGTTGRGIGPVYEDKVARRVVHVMDLFDEDLFRSKLSSLIEYHNFILKELFGAEGVDAEEVLKDWMDQFDKIRNLVVDSSKTVNEFRASNSNILFEGAQGSMLDIDQGTYPFVTSSSTLSGASSLGSGIGPLDIDGVLGITKAYATRVVQDRSQRRSMMITASIWQKLVLNLVPLRVGLAGAVGWISWRYVKPLISTPYPTYA